MVRAEAPAITIELVFAASPRCLHRLSLSLPAGATVADALLQAGLIRMRPIVMTTMAMVFGMLPLALALNDGGEIQAPMGRAIIGGVITSTILTLVVVPVLYSYLVRDRKPAPVSGVEPMLMPAGKD